MNKTLSLTRIEKTFLFTVLLITLIIILGSTFLLPSLVIMVVFNAFFLFLIVFYLLLFLNKSSHGKKKEPKKFESVTIIIPMYNSKSTIIKCINSVKRIKWKGKKEIIVVDDASTDGSLELIKKIKGIKIIKHKKNQGKSIALNNAIKKIDSKYIVCVDSDSYPEKNILTKSMGYFEEKKVMAVTCTVLPDKRKTLLQRIQFIEYLAGFGLNNTLLSSISSSYVVPGPFTIIKKSVFSELGGFEKGNLAEDMEFGLRLKKSGYKIINCFEGIVYTDVPNTWKGLFKQRDRWSRGGVFNFVKYKKLFFNKTSPNFGFLVMPLLFTTQVLTVGIIVRMVLFLLNDLIKSIVLIINYFLLGGIIFFDFSKIIFPSSIYFFGATYLLLIIYFLIAFNLTKQELGLRDLPALVILIFIYPFFISLIYSQSYLKEMIGVRGEWLRVST